MLMDTFFKSNIVPEIDLLKRKVAFHPSTFQGPCEFQGVYVHGGTNLGHSPKSPHIFPFDFLNTSAARAMIFETFEASILDVLT